MRIFGHYFFEDPDDRKFKEEWQEKRSQRVIQQCELYGTKEDKTFWDMIELPSKSVKYTHEDTAREDFKFHAELMKKQECHIFYGKKFCYHTENGEIITDIAGALLAV